MAHRIKTNLDLSQNHILNGGFERVIALPLENNVLGRQVLFEGKPYWWNGEKWISWEEIDPNQFWQTDKANAEVSPIFAMASPGNSFITFLADQGNDALKRSRQILVGFYTAVADMIHTNFINDTKYLSDNVRYQVLARVERNITDIPFTVTFPLYDSDSNLIVATNLIVKREGSEMPYYEFTFTGECIVNLIRVQGVTYVTIDSNADITLATPKDDTLTTFINDNNVTKSYDHNSFSLLSLLSTLINKLNQGGGGATGDFWSLTQANSEVEADIFYPENDNTGVIEEVLKSKLISPPDEILPISRDIIVDFSNYAGERDFKDFFSTYISNSNGVEQKFPFQWLLKLLEITNVPILSVRFRLLLCNNHSDYPIAIMVPDNDMITTNFPNVNIEIITPYSDGVKFFYLYPYDSVSVDFEVFKNNIDNQLRVNITAHSSWGTATLNPARCSTDEYASVIERYLISRGIPYTYYFEHYLYNVQDLVASLIANTKAIEGNYWSLTKANAEVSACEISINNSTESVFPKILERYGNYIHSRNILVDLSNYSDFSNYILDIFGDITNVPTGIRYSIFLYGYSNSLKIDFPLTYKTNITATHTPDGISEERYTIAYSGATKIDFIKLSNSIIWVDV